MNTTLKTLASSTAAALGCGILAAFTAPAPAPAEASAAATLAMAPAAGSYTIDSGHTTAVFRTKHLGVAYFYGRFNDVSGSYEFDPENPKDSSIEVEIKAESIDTNSGQRDGHLKSPDFLAAKEFPTIEFKSTKVKKKGDGFEVTGDLTLHGVTKAVTAKAEFVGASETYQGFKSGFVATFTIDMNDFEMSYVKENSGALGPEVDITLSIEGLRQ